MTSPPANTILRRSPMALVAAGLTIILIIGFGTTWAQEISLKGNVHPIEADGLTLEKGMQTAGQKFSKTTQEGLYFIGYIFTAVNEQRERGVTRTTVLKQVQRLEDAGYLVRDDSRPASYTSLVDEADATKAATIKTKMNTKRENHYNNISKLLTTEQITWFEQNYNQNKGKGYGRGQGCRKGTRQGYGRGYGRGSDGCLRK